mmetsp:Transcript_72056/g.166941  ORF Transcript_72056/g.166941 Transcript_72056/m.166941 type:complete len:205 (+) Transcript_72056:1926-2540(+)
MLQVAQQELLHELRLPVLEVEGAHHPEQRRNTFAQPRAQVGVEPLLEALARKEVQDELLQRVRPGVLGLQLIKELADRLLLLLCQRNQGLVGVCPALVLSLPNGHAPLGFHAVLRRQPAPDGHAFWVQRSREGADGRGQRRCTPLAAAEARRGERRPEAMEALLVGHVGHDVHLVLGVDAHQLPIDLRCLRVALQEHVEAALHL